MPSFAAGLAARAMTTPSTTATQRHPSYKLVVSIIDSALDLIDADGFIDATPSNCGLKQ
jgi:hypothetical protein